MEDLKKHTENMGSQLGPMKDAIKKAGKSVSFAD